MQRGDGSKGDRIELLAIVLAQHGRPRAGDSGRDPAFEVWGLLDAADRLHRPAHVQRDPQASEAGRSADPEHLEAAGQAVANKRSSEVEQFLGVTGAWNAAISSWSLGPANSGARGCRKFEVPGLEIAGPEAFV